MRPSDENQAASSHDHLRPNLMSSSRRSGHEDSILAKLEREPARRERGRIGKRLAWYGGAALAAVSLTAVLAWLAAGSGPQALEVAHANRSRPAPIGDALTAAAPTTHEILQPLPLSDNNSALIVDTAPAQESAQASAQASVQASHPAHTPAPATPPPLRMLDAAAARPPPAGVTAALTAAAAPARAAAASVRAAREGARPALPRARPAPARVAARQATRPARAGNASRSGEQDDSDVALISAVIYHANGHAVGQGDGQNTSSCADEACRALPARQ